ncbi:hypothetical protein Sste5346_004975 [Sporothrix stenoceras]|uniref:gamma-glutamylcyclotransferase n=1 Tax=Sporothrix stenoceras TaxID=5173 RepID=A0ABR3Z5P8_9PEZI
MAFHTKSSFQSNGSAHVHDNNDNNDVIIYIGDVDSDSDNMATDDDTLPPPAGLAATVVRKAIEIETETPVDDATTSSDSSSTPSPPAKRRIPHTSAERIALATPEVELEQPVLASKYLAKQEQSRLLSEKTPLLSSTQSTSTEPTVLYLAYGSNMAAKTFEGTRGIKPISCVTVSAPTLQLTFDLPGVPYREPCFANTAFRKPPKSPPKVPDIPDVPPIPAPPGPPGPPQNPPVEVEAEAKASTTRFELDSHGDPIWDGPLYGVVYEVTRDDYAQIIATEGGGASYQDVLVPCLVVAPRMGVPEKPDIPVVPRPFLAHTLFAPQVPADKKAIAGETDGGDNDGGDGDDDDGDDGNWLARRWRAMVKRLVRFASARGRPDPGYAQPSKRYLGLLTSGAADHELPQAYQDWLGSLQPYTITSRRQTIGSILLIITALPFLLIILGVNWLPRRKGSTGRMSPAMVIVIGSIFRSVWWVYDHVFHPVFGDGERTEPSKDEGAAKSETKSIKA